MRTEDFNHWLAQLADLSPSQCEQALAQLTARQQSAQVISAITDACHECPHCHQSPVMRWGNAHGLARYRCQHCRKTFNALTGTPLARLRHRECWTTYAQALIDGAAVRAAAKRCGVHKDTAFRWRHRFLTQPVRAQPAHLHGIVEADETYILESFKGQRQLPRPARKRGGVAAKRGLSHEQIPILIARDRERTTFAAILPRADSAAVNAALGSVIDHDAVLCTDSNAIYRAFAAKAQIAHKPVNLRAGIRVREQAFHIQNVNAYDSRLKAWLARFHGVATHYLPNYLAWRRNLEQFAESLTPSTFLRAALKNNYQHLTQT